MENRNNQSRKRASASKSRLRRMFEGRGVYIALCSLAVVIGIFAYLGRADRRSSGNIAFDDDAWQKAVNESKIETETDNKSDSAAQDADKASDAEGEGPAMTERRPDKTDSDAAQTVVPRENVIDVDAAVEASTVAEPQTAAADGKMTEPCIGRVITDCSLDDLVYCAAMDDWRTHNGIDYAAAEGEAVKATAGGTVSRVYNDDILGATIVIDHGNGLSTLYASLDGTDSARVGANVKAGDVIGAVGKSCALEKNLEPHLHFEVLKDGNPQNPNEYFGS